MTIKYNLYSSEGCHLCEEALALFKNAKPLNEINIIDIVEDDKLVELYGISIPVLESINSDKKLFWPFTQEQINQLT
ncbi:glutaredoxin family protein [Pseudocolwellia sp. HL-MZ19]|uniref:glutaredoxin family protein n=1 Tax=unclassified Pseudocolwellia TaxID=2848178 RepID=UPI003CE9E219